LFAQLRAGLEEERLVRVTTFSALAQQVDTLTAQLIAMGGNIEAQSHALDVLRTTTEQIGATVTTEAQKATALKSDIYGIMGIIDGRSTAIDELHTIASYLNGELVTQATHINQIEAVQGEDRAVVSVLKEAFVSSDGTVRAGYNLKVDANGVITGIEASSQSAPGMPDLSVLKFQANTIQVQVEDRLYSLVQDQPVLQMVGAGVHSGDATWTVRNAHIPIWMPANGPWQGGAAEVKVYEADGE
jgi:hypothetical protein